MRHLLYAGLQLTFFWAFLVLYCICVIPLSIVAALIEGEKK